MSSHPAPATRRTTTASRKVAGSRPTKVSGAREVITLTRDGQFTRIDPAVDQLAEVFYTVEHAVRDDEDHGWKMSRFEVSLVCLQTTHDDTRYQLCGVGLEPLVEQRLRQQGYTVRRRGQRPGALPAPARGKLERLRRVDTDVLDCIQQHDRALIRCTPSRKQLTQVVIQVAFAWPETNVVVCVSPDDDALRPEDCLWDMLLEMNPGAEDSVYGVQVGNVRAGDYAEVGNWLPEMEGPTILLIPEPTKLLRTKAGREVLWQAKCSRINNLNNCCWSNRSDTS